MKKFQNAKQFIKDNDDIGTGTLISFMIFCFPILLLEFSFKFFRIPVVILSAVLSTVFTSYILYILCYVYIYFCEYIYFVARSFWNKFS